MHDIDSEIEQVFKPHRSSDEELRQLEATARNPIDPVVLISFILLALLVAGIYMLAH